MITQGTDSPARDVTLDSKRDGGKEKVWKEGVGKEGVRKDGGGEDGAGGRRGEGWMGGGGEDEGASAEAIFRDSASVYARFLNTEGREGNFTKYE